MPVILERSDCVCRHHHHFDKLPRLCGDIFITVPPHITPFDFGSETLNAGDSASVTCTINKGDFPITIEWFLNGKPVRAVEGITVNSLMKKLSYLGIDSVQAVHSGKYTCRATNWAGSAYYTVELSVNGTIYFICITATYFSSCCRLDFTFLFLCLFRRLLTLHFAFLNV